MMAGADWVHSVVFRQARLLAESGRYRFCAYGFGAASARPGDRPAEEVFEAIYPAPPEVAWRGGVRDLLELLPAAAGAAWPRRDASLAPCWSDRAKDAVTASRHARLPPEVLGGYDLYHWHCFVPDRLPVIELLPAGAKLIITLWGSDLYRSAGIREYALQLRACARATVFTVASVEMRETFLAKFGREWADKFRIINYGACTLESIDRVSAGRDEILERFGIAPEKVVMVVGNSGGRGNRHLEVLSALGRLPSEAAASLAVVVPMTYPHDAAYIANVRAAAAQAGLSAIILDRYLPEDRIAELRSVTDIAIHVPVSDQFSAAMCEALYAGAVLITGAWLPYSRLRLAGIYYHEVAEIAELGAEVGCILQRLADEKRRAAAGCRSIRDIVAWNAVIPRWLTLYDELTRLDEQ